MGVNDIPGASQLQALAEQSDEAQLRHIILDLVGEYARSHHAPQTFVPGESPVPVSGKVYGAEDMQALVDSSLDFWLTTGRVNAAIEEKLEARIGVQTKLTTNSGSPANPVGKASRRERVS